MNTSLYVLFHDNDINHFKIGKHSGELGRLMTRYRTHSSKKYTIIAFYPGFGHLEYPIHNHLHQYRMITKDTKRLSEWFSCNIDIILAIISKFIKNDIEISFSGINPEDYYKQEDIA